MEIDAEVITSEEIAVALKAAAAKIKRRRKPELKLVWNAPPKKE